MIKNGKAYADDTEQMQVRCHNLHLPKSSHLMLFLDARGKIQRNCVKTQGG